MRFYFLVSLILLLLFTSGAMATRIVLVAGSVPLIAEDEIIKGYLEDIGCEVEPHGDDEEAHPVDISGADAVYISESVSSVNITDAYKDAPIPVIVSESYVLDDMQFAPDGTFVLPENQTRIVIEDPAHPIAGGLTGEVEVLSSPAMIQSCSDMQGDVHIVATINDNPCIAYYEAGATLMDGSVTPDRRVFIFPHTNSISAGLTDAGWKLMQRSVCWALALDTCEGTAQVEPQIGQHWYTTFGGINYLLFLPTEYAEKTDVEWPLILYLHGAGASMASLRNGELPAKVDVEQNFPFIVLSPLFTGRDANLFNACFDLLADRPVNYELINPILDEAMTLVDEIAATCRIDTSRIYVTGVSQGGFMTLLLAAAYPERFAALAPLAGTGDPETACRLKTVPIWAFTGEVDQTVTLGEVQEIINAVEVCGSNVKLTVYPGKGHEGFVWDATYSNPELYSWFTSYRLVNGVSSSVSLLDRFIVTWGSLKQK